MSRMRLTSRKGYTRVVEGDMSRLPLWAQNKIQYLQRDLEEARSRFASMGRQLDPLKTEPRGTIAYGDYMRGETEIPGGDKVTFYFGGDSEITVCFNDDRTGLLFQASGTLVHHAQASNTFELYLQRDRLREKLEEVRASESARRILLRPSGDQ